MLSDTAVADIVQAMGVLPEDVWNVNDDACDCTYQRIGMWTNPYIKETLEVRMCCIWKELYKLFPQHVRTVPAFQDYNNDGQWVEEVREWDGESDMPRSIWYRHLATKLGKPIAEIRAEYGDQPVPKGIPRPVVEREPEPDPIEILWEAVLGLAEEVSTLRARLEA